MFGTNLLSGILSLIPQALILVAAMIYWGKVKNTGSNMMFYGSLGATTLHLIQSIILPILMITDIIGYEFFLGGGSLGLSVLNFLANGIFAVGLLMLVTGGKKSA